MISIYKTDNIKVGEEDTVIYGELRGLSTDTKPSKINEKKFDAESEEWKEA